MYLTLLLLLFVITVGLGCYAMYTEFFTEPQEIDKTCSREIDKILNNYPEYPFEEDKDLRDKWKNKRYRVRNLQEQCNTIVESISSPFAVILECKHRGDFVVHIDAGQYLLSLEEIVEDKRYYNTSEQKTKQKINELIKHYQATKINSNLFNYSDIPQVREYLPCP